MGKGGEQSVNVKETVPAQKLKLQHMPTEELRKWAKAYGVSEDLERERLLLELVRIICNAFVHV